MKRVTASEARRHWFRLLDEILDGETVVIERKGRRVVLQREKATRALSADAPDYARVLRVPDVEHADTWSWDWNGEEAELRSKSRDEP